MFDQTPKGRGFELCSGFVVNRHGRWSRFGGMIRKRSCPDMEASILISGGNCHRFCHIGAQNRPSGSMASSRFTGGPRQIVNHLI
jgi:hypothetical protein